MDDKPLRKIFFLFSILCILLITAYILFIAGVSINVGLHHIQEDGFWVPLLFGLAVTVFILRLSLYGIIHIRRQMKEKDIIHHI